jgi:GNAT superfamily N-acetyltransferase
MEGRGRAAYKTGMVAQLRRRLGVHFYYMLVRPLQAAPPTCMPSGLVHRVLDEQLLVAHCADARLDLKESNLRAALAAGDLCVGALHEGRLAAYVWYAFGSTRQAPGVRVEFAPRVRYTYKLHVHPGLRGCGLGRELLAHGARLAPQRGRDLDLSFVAPDNRPSLRAFAAAGWRRAGYAGYAKALGGFVDFTSAGAARVEVRFVNAKSGSEPEFALR